MSNKIYPVGLKGNEVTDRMKQLMGVNLVREDAKTSVIELTKKGPDGNVYGVVRENHEYYIKVTNKTKDIVVEDFSYIGGLKNKKDFAYPSYAKAIKQLNLKFNSLNEAYGKSGQINIFENDHLEEAKSSCCDAAMTEGKCSECGIGALNEADKNNPWAICTSSVGRKDKEKYEACVKDVKKEKGVKESLTEEDFSDGPLSEVEQAVEDMMESDETPEDVKPEVVKEHKLSIAIAINEMDNIIESITRKKKVYTLK